MWYGITVTDMFSTVAGRKVLNHFTNIVRVCLYHTWCMKDSCYFFRNLSCSNNTILRAIVALPKVRYEALGMASMFNIDLYGNCSAVSIKSAIWCSFY